MKAVSENDLIEYFAHMLDESTDKNFISKIPAVIQALIDEFSNETVRNPMMVYQLSDRDLHRIYDILNTHMFNGYVSDNIQLQYWPESKIVAKMNEYAFKSGVFDRTFTAAPCYGVHSAVCKDVLDKDGNIVDVLISDDIIMMNQSTLLPCTFIFIVASICHEMIHFYDHIAANEYHDLALKQSQSGNEEDFHNTRIFQMKMDEANKNGINVFVAPEKDDSYKTLNDRAFYVLQSVLPENASNTDTMVIAGKQMVFMKSKKTGIGILAHFD